MDTTDSLHSNLMVILPAPHEVQLLQATQAGLFTRAFSGGIETHCDICRCSRQLSLLEVTDQTSSHRLHLFGRLALDRPGLLAACQLGGSFPFISVSCHPALAWPVLPYPGHGLARPVLLCPFLDSRYVRLFWVIVRFCLSRNDFALLIILPLESPGAPGHQAAAANVPLVPEPH
jgi:hypothetical protein